MGFFRGLQISCILVVLSYNLVSCALVARTTLDRPLSTGQEQNVRISPMQRASASGGSREIDSDELLRLRGGSTVSEARLKAQAQALAAVRAKAQKMGIKTNNANSATAGTPTSTKAPTTPTPAAATTPAAQTQPVPSSSSSTHPAPTTPRTSSTHSVSASDFAAAPVAAAPVAAPKPSSPQPTTTTRNAPVPAPTSSTASASAAAAAPQPRTPMPVYEPDSDTSQIPGGDEPVQAISGAGSVKKVTDIAQKNRLLVMQCKALRARATDPKMKERLDARIFELEAAWSNYVKVDTSTTQHSLFAPKKIVINRSPSELILDEQTARRGKARIPVTFTVRCALTSVGERLLLLGDIEELGSWNPLAAVPLDTTNTTYPLWHATVDMPAGAIVEYKYAIGTPGIFREQYDIVEWEGYMGNRGFKVPRKAHHIHEEYVEGVNHGQEIDYDVPEFLTMHRIGGSECFLDPEYASIY